MEILSARPQCLTLEARHTISLAVAKRRRLSVASSLFMPKLKPLQDEMNPQVEADPRTDSTVCTSLSKKKYIEKSIYSREHTKSYNNTDSCKSTQASRPYDPRVISTSWASQFRQPNQYTSKLASRLESNKFPKTPRSFEGELAMINNATQPPPALWKKKARTSGRLSGKQLNQHTTCEIAAQPQGISLPPVEDFEVICNDEPSPVDDKSEVTCFYTENEQIACDTSAQTQQPSSHSAGTFIVISDDDFVTESSPLAAEENSETFSHSCHHASTQTQGSPVSAISSLMMRNDNNVRCCAPDGTAVPTTSSLFDIGQGAEEQKQQMLTTTQDQSPTMAPNPYPPQSSISANVGPLQNNGFQSPSGRFEGNEKPQPRIFLPPDENARILSMLSQLNRPPSYRQEVETVLSGSDIYRVPDVSAPPKKPTKPRRKTNERSKQQDTQNPRITPPGSIYQETYPHSYPHYGCPKPVYAQQFMYFICPQSGSHIPAGYPSENCLSYSHPHMIPPNHTAPEIRYRPYHCISRPALMYHQPIPEPSPPQNRVALPPLPASLAPADMAKWLTSQVVPQPQPDYAALERQLADYHQALTGYPVPPQDNNAYMKSFSGEYAEAVQSSSFFPDRSPARTYGLPKMSDSGPSSYGPYRGYFPSAQHPTNSPTTIPLCGTDRMGHSHVMPSFHSRYVHYEQPMAVRFPSHSQKPIASKHISSNISPALRRLSINEQVPEEFYRNGMNVPEYDPRDSR